VALKREPTPPGPISRLFDRLHDLYLRAGEPGVREISRGMGRDRVSPTTVHNVFRGPKVPRWEPLRKVVVQFNGDVDPFLALWTAVLEAERRPPGWAGRDHPVPATDERSFAVVVITNRMPFSGNAEVAAQSQWHVAMLAAMRRFGTPVGAWIGWSEHDPQPGAATYDGTPLHTIDLSTTDVKLHYDGYCNATLWPLYHQHIERPKYDPAWRRASREVNQRYADAVVHLAAPGALVWIHDYQLQLVPDLIRRQRRDPHCCIEAKGVLANA